MSTIATRIREVPIAQGLWRVKLSALWRGSPGQKRQTNERRSWPVRAVNWGFGVLFVPVAVVVVLNIFYPRPAWNMAREGNLATYLHSGILMAIAVTFWAVYALGERRHQGRTLVPGAIIWLLGGFAFLYLSLDEAMEVHERIFAKVFQELGLWDRVLHYQLSPALWEALFAPLFGAIGVLLLVVLLLLRHRQRVRDAFRLGMGAMALWAYALAMEAIGLVFLRGSAIGYTFAVRTEEIAEMLGSTLFLVASVLIARHLLAEDNATGGKVKQAKR